MPSGSHKWYSLSLQVYVPLVKTQADWGQIKLNEDRHEFMEKLEEFDDDLQQKIQNLQGGAILLI